MKHQNPFSVSVGIMVILGLYACRAGQEQPTPAQELYAAFHSIAPSDTLAVKLDTVAGESSREISAGLFLAGVDAVLIGEMIYEPDTFDFHGRAYWKISLDENFDACLLDIKQVWFQFKYGLIYSKASKSFVGLVPLAYLFGGDGGQIVSESWIFDVETQPTIVTRNLEHHLRWSETNPDEPESINIQSVELKRWSQGEFQEVPVRDSSKWIQRYPLVWD